MVYPTTRPRPGQLFLNHHTFAGFSTSGGDFATADLLRTAGMGRCICLGKTVTDELSDGGGQERHQEKCTVELHRFHFGRIAGFKRLASASNYHSSRGGNSNVIFPLPSITKNAGNGLPAFDINFSSRSLLPSARIFFACAGSMGCSKITLPIVLNLHGLESACDFSQI